MMILSRDELNAHLVAADLVLGPVGDQSGNWEIKKAVDPDVKVLVLSAQPGHAFLCNFVPGVTAMSGYASVVVGRTYSGKKGRAVVVSITMTGLVIVTDTLDIHELTIANFKSQYPTLCDVIGP